MNETCQERIIEHFEGRMDDLRILWDLYMEDSEAEDYDIGNMYDYGLAFDYVAPHTFKEQDEGYFRYQLSWGGPSDEFRIYASPGGGRGQQFSVYRIEYWFLDWFDGAHKILLGADRKLLEEIFYNFFDDSGTTTVQYDEAMIDYRDEDDYDEDEEDEETEDDFLESVADKTDRYEEFFSGDGVPDDVKTAVDNIISGIRKVLDNK